MRRADSKRMQKIRLQLKTINANVQEHMKLGNRTTSALDELLTHKQLTFVLRAVENLAAVTKWSFSCCERLVEHRAVPIIFQLIRSCNRSKPHLVVLHHSLRILLHLARCPSTISCIFDEPDSLSLLVELLQMYRDKSDIFASACQLLIALCRDQGLAHLVLKEKQLVSRIDGIHRLLERKSKLDAKTRAKN